MARARVLADKENGHGSLRDNLLGALKVLEALCQLGDGQQSVAHAQKKHRCSV
jgi:hypothetical protein